MNAFVTQKCAPLTLFCVIVERDVEHYSTQLNKMAAAAHGKMRSTLSYW